MNFTCRYTLQKESLPWARIITKCVSNALHATKYVFIHFNELMIRWRNNNNKYNSFWKLASLVKEMPKYIARVATMHNSDPLVMDLVVVLTLSSIYSPNSFTCFCPSFHCCFSSSLLLSFSSFYLYLIGELERWEM